MISNKTVARLLIKLVIVGVVLALASTSIVIVDETEVAVVTRFGKITENIHQPGLSGKLPWPVDRTIYVDKRILLLENSRQELLTVDQKNVLVSGFILWQIEDPKTFVKTLGNRTSAEIRLRDLYLSKIGSTVSSLSRNAFLSVGTEKEDMDFVTDTVRDKIASVTRDEFGIDVLTLQFYEFTMPEDNRPSVIERMKAERARIAARYRSEGEEAALKIEAQANREHEMIMARAHAAATETIGTAEAEALHTLADAYRADPEFYRFQRALESYRAIIDEQTTLFLPADAKLFEVLNEGSGEPSE